MGQSFVSQVGLPEKLRIRRARRLTTGGAGIALAALLATPARAATYEWTDPASGNWSTDDFWSPGPPPNNGGNQVDLIFYTDMAAPSSYVATNDLNAPYDLHSIAFRNFAQTDITLA